MKEDNTQFRIDNICRYLNNPVVSSFLIYGELEEKQAILKGVYEEASKRDNLLCSFHDSSKIKTPLDFFEPILKLKWGQERYEKFKQSDYFKSLDDDEIRILAGLCGKEENSQNPQERKFPIFFIDGIEKFFFNMDYGHLSQDKESLLESEFSHLNMHSKKFSESLRVRLKDELTGAFIGTVDDEQGIEYDLTLGTARYLFYAGNFICKGERKTNIPLPWDI